MAAPSRTVPHPGRALVLLLVLIVAMLLGVLGPKLFAPSQWEHRFKVGLGLDLSSGTQVTLRAQTLTGKAPSTDEMNAAVGVIESRVNGTGNSGAQVHWYLGGTDPTSAPHGPEVYRFAGGTNWVTDSQAYAAFRLTVPGPGAPAMCAIETPCARITA